jgi:iron-sulfur cluster repair protein YtfE (RIC family)
MHLIQIQTNATRTTGDPHTLVTATPIMELNFAHPELQPVLDRFGLDTCCGGHLTVTEACGEHGLDAAVVANALLEVLEAHRAE